MSVNFEKYKSELLSAWKDVLDDQSPTNWAVFGYEDNTNTLRLVTKSEGALEELENQFSISQIQYAFCRCVFKDSDIPKFFIIHWLGEAAPPKRKMDCANHINDITSFFRRSSMTVEARNEEDLDANNIIKTLERITVKTTDLKRRSVDENVSPVGTNYQRIQPQKEISSSERKTFWNNMKKEESQRQEEEKKRHEQEKATRLSLNASSKLVTRDSHNNSDSPLETNNQSYVSQITSSYAANNQSKKPEKSSENGVGKATSLVKQRLEFLNQIINENKPCAKPIEAARKGLSIKERISSIENRGLTKVEERNSKPIEEVTWNTSGKDFSRNQNSVEEIRVMTESVKISQEEESFEPKPFEPVISGDTHISLSSLNIHAEERTSSPDNEEDDVKPQASHEGDPSDDEENLEELDEEEYEVNPQESLTTQIRNYSSESAHFQVKTSCIGALPDIQEEPEASYDSSEISESERIFREKIDLEYPRSQFGIRARALHNYTAVDDTEISFDRDQIITHIDKVDPGWWQGLAPNGVFGLFPANYVQCLD